MTAAEASQTLLTRIIVSREDITRAKVFALNSDEDTTDTLANQWLGAELGPLPVEVDIQSAGAQDTLTLLARAYSLRLAFYRATWELVAACEVFPAGGQSWEPRVTWRDSHQAGDLDVRKLYCVFPSRIVRPPFSSTPPTDPDVFLQGSDCVSLHQGIREAISQSLTCFRRGLYLPAIVMLAAGAEATWIVCGTAVALKLGDKKLGKIVDNPFVGLGQKVSDTRKSLDSPDGKVLLKAASTTAAKLADAEIWTTTLRDRRNAVHWGKAQGFIAQHSDASSLLLAAPLHLGTLESVRRACE